MLGLRLSAREDAVLAAGEREHHGVSVIGADVDALHHYAWQLDAFATFARVGDHLLQHGDTFLWGPGHHGIGRQLLLLTSATATARWSSTRPASSASRTRRPTSRASGPDEPLTVNRWGNPAPPAEFVDAATPITVPVVA